ncbi:MAG: type II toxin-antitoxin system Phd/YefM family antitoxin [Lachnospiraceae bacterium]|nr:type II toxin-antitoxin system Phd/YefM family antitoxin [Lachnospiraceae bacterium]
MIIAKQMEIRNNIKKFFDLAYNGETIIVPRIQHKNVVIISETEYNHLCQLARVNAYSNALNKIQIDDTE